MYEMIKFNNGVSFEMCDIPNRKKPGICIQTENEIACYGFFRDEDCAKSFMSKLKEAVRAKS